MIDPAWIQIRSNAGDTICLLRKSIIGLQLSADRTCTIILTGGATVGLGATSVDEFCGLRKELAISKPEDQGTWETSKPSF